MTETTPSDRITVYYDGGCPLCRREIAMYARRDGGSRLDLVDVDARPAALAGDGVGVRDALARFHVRRPDGRLVDGAAAFVEIWRRVPGFGWLARLARLPGAMPVLEAGYRAFLKLRPRLTGRDPDAVACRRTADTP